MGKRPPAPGPSSLTAAHCIMNPETSKAIDFEGKEATIAVLDSMNQSYGVKDLHLYESFFESNFTAGTDIMLVELTHPISLPSFPCLLLEDWTHRKKLYFFGDERKLVLELENCSKDMERVVCTRQTRDSRVVKDNSGGGIFSKTTDGARLEAVHSGVVEDEQGYIAFHTLLSPLFKRIKETVGKRERRAA